MKNAQCNRGGKREGAGRKPCTDKKQQIIIYFHFY